MKTTRRLTQLAFLLLTLVSVFVVRGEAERWCPFGGIEALYSYVTAGSMTCSLAVSNFFILGAVLLLTLLLRRAFCSYMCPIGTISEWLRAVAGGAGLPTLHVPYTLDRTLALLKYPVLAIILYITWKSGELLFRGFDPCYALISRHGKDITFWAYVAAGGIVVFSLFLLLPFCRWLCPLAAVFTPFSRFGLARLKRNIEACTDCGECTSECPMGIRVDRVEQVTAARCTLCLDCVAACPEIESGALQWGPPGFLGGRWRQPVLLALILLCVGAAVAATYAFPLPSFVQTVGEPVAQTRSVELAVEGVTCRGSSAGLVNWLTRDDGYGILGYLKVETWPDPGFATVRITFDPTQTTESDIKRAIVLPQFDLLEAIDLESPYTIDGYAPTVDDL